MTSGISPGGQFVHFGNKLYLCLSKQLHLKFSQALYKLKAPTPNS